MKPQFYCKQQFICICICISLLFFQSCKKNGLNTITTESQSKDGGPNQSFNWESPSGGTMMGFANIAPGPLNPTMPWTSQSGSYIDPYLVNDYKKSDGWELVYNTFNPNYYQANASNGGLYFALYNKFRGLLRYYLYIPSGQFGGGQNIQHGLEIYTGNGGTTSMLNFDGSDIVDPSTNISAFTKTNNVGVAQQGGWYAMQYEIAYDPNFRSASFPNLGIAWNSRTINVSSIQANGTQLGTLTGTITQQSNDGLGSTIINGVLAAGEIYGTASGGSTGWNSAAQGGVSGNLTNFLSGIFGGNSNNSQEVDLKMNSTINLSGTITSTNTLAPNTFVFPGESIAPGNGSYPPLYNNLLGVFNLTGRPIIHIAYIPLSGQPNNPDHPWDYRPNGDYYLNTLTVDQSVLNSVFVTNPALNGLATVSIVKQEILLENVGDFFYQTVPVIENIGNITVYHGNNSFDGIKWNPVVDGPVILRLTIRVAPNGSSTFPAVTIVKTFAVNQVTP